MASQCAVEGVLAASPCCCLEIVRNRVFRFPADLQPLLGSLGALPVKAGSAGRCLFSGEGNKFNGLSGQATGATSPLPSVNTRVENETHPICTDNTYFRTVKRLLHAYLWWFILESGHYLLKIQYTRNDCMPAGKSVRNTKNSVQNRVFFGAGAVHFGAFGITPRKNGSPSVPRDPPAAENQRQLPYAFSPPASAGNNQSWTTPTTALRRSSETRCR